MSLTSETVGVIRNVVVDLGRTVTFNVGRVIVGSGTLGFSNVFSLF